MYLYLFIFPLFHCPQPACLTEEVCPDNYLIILIIQLLLIAQEQNRINYEKLKQM